MAPFPLPDQHLPRRRRRRRCRRRRQSRGIEMRHFFGSNLPAANSPPGRSKPRKGESQRAGGAGMVEQAVCVSTCACLFILLVVRRYKNGSKSKPTNNAAQKLTHPRPKKRLSYIDKKPHALLVYLKGIERAAARREHTAKSHNRCFSPRLQLRHHSTTTPPPPPPPSLA